VAVKVFDLAVNVGPRQAHRLLQRALRACGRDVAEDGVIGPETLGAIAGVAGAGESPFAIVASLRSEAAGFYRTLIARRPLLAVFERGWLRRAYA
jgi:lysozyme family protein